MRSKGEIVPVQATNAYKGRKAPFKHAPAALSPPPGLTDMEGSGDGLI